MYSEGIEPTHGTENAEEIPEEPYNEEDYPQEDYSN